MAFVKETWYVAGWSEEISREMLSRKLCNEQILFYRKRDGSPVAIADLCPHRFIPLSRGKLLGDNVECAYHGLAFDCSGKCIDNPHGAGVIPQAAQVRSYPLTEQYGLVWIWMGDPANADPARVPELPWLTDTKRYSQSHGTILLNANHLLVLDNLTDLSHAGFIHENTLESREIAKASLEVSEANGRIWVKQFVPSMSIPPIFANTQGLTGQMDHWLEMRCDPPGVMVTFFGVTQPGRPREEGLGTYNPNLITPETETTTHYFWATARDFAIHDKDLTAKINAGARYAFEEEDRPVIEEQQRILGTRDLMDLKPVLLPNDRGSGQARRIIKRMLDAEAACPGLVAA